MSSDLRPAPSLWSRGALGALAALVVNLLIFVIARLADVSFTIPTWDGDGTQTIGAGAVTGNTVVPLALAVLLTAVVLRRWPRRARTLAVIAVVVTIVSFAPPLTLEAPAATRTVLALMHPSVLVAYLAVLRPALRAAGNPVVDVPTTTTSTEAARQPR
jgi:hypothetical protein